MQGFRKLFLRLRRSLLKSLVPEWVWPRSVDIEGVSIAVRGAPYSFSIKRLLSKNPQSYERAERQFLQYLDASDHVLEYGSSIGILTALICDKVRDGRVVSIEASAALIDYSKTWLSRYKNLELINAAAFPVYERLNLNLKFDDSSGSLGGLVNIEPGAQKSDLDAFFVRDAFEIEGFEPNTLFVDIEGGETIILEHQMDFPTSVEKLFIELHPYLYGNQVESEIIAAIEQQGFDLVKRIEAVYFFKRQ